MVNYRNTTTVTNTSTTVASKGVDVQFLNIVNRHSAIIWVKFYDAPVATFQDTPVKTFQVAANGSITLGWVPFSTSNGLAVRATTASTDSDNTAPGSLPILELSYSF